MSPTVFREGPYRFYFNSREEERLHVHIEAPSGELKVWLEPRIEVAQNHGIPDREVTKILRILEQRHGEVERAGASTADVEVTSISKHGFWLYLSGRELFVDFREFPWFADAPINHVMNVRWPTADDLSWPDLDVDLSVESIEHPERFPLQFEPSKRAG